jgi:ribosomal protein L11 methylase PrmA
MRGEVCATTEALVVSVPTAFSEMVGAMLFDALGPFEEVEMPTGRVELTFFPRAFSCTRGTQGADGEDEGTKPTAPPTPATPMGLPSQAAVLSLLPVNPELRSTLRIYRMSVLGGWEEGWKDHFRPLRVGRVFVRPPWESPGGATATTDSAIAAPAPRGHSEPPLVDVVIDPGLAFGTGLHPTTRGVLELLQKGRVGGPLLDAGTGTGILSIAAFGLGYAPITAFDNDPLAVQAALSNLERNGVPALVVQAGVEDFPAEWFTGATVVANIALVPALKLLERIAGATGSATASARAGATSAGSEGGAALPTRVLVAGILLGAQEVEFAAAAANAGFVCTGRLCEGEWVTLEIVPKAWVRSEEGGAACLDPSA